MTTPRILFVCDAGPDVGGGHVMRSLTLAGSLQAFGASVAFLAPPAVASVLAAFAPPRLKRIGSPGPDIDGLVASAQAAVADFDIIAFDHYRLIARHHRKIAAGRRTLVIDDLADRILGADVLLDSGPARRPSDYGGLVPNHARLLIGPAFAPVRPEFTALRAQALAQRAAAPPLRRLLVSLGLTDVGGLTGQVVQRILPLLGDVAVDVVLGAGAPSLPALQALAARDRRIVLHVNTQAMAALTLAADAAIGAAGSTTWERCTLGLPTLQITVADNQRPAAGAMAQAGAALVVDRLSPDFANTFDEAFTRLTADADLRTALAVRAARICDGGGAGRVADAVLALAPSA